MFWEMIITLKISTTTYMVLFSYRIDAFGALYSRQLDGNQPYIVARISTEKILRQKR